MNTQTNFLQEFDEDVKASSTIPYLQVQNPPNLTLAQIQQYKPPYGWFIPDEQAKLVEFSPNDWFTPTRLTFGEDTSQPKQVDGWLTQHVRVFILHKSSGIEVQEKTERGWHYVGPAYHKGQLTKCGQSANEDKENYRLRTRYLLVFLDESNQPLHRIPLQLSMGRGTGGTFGEEVRQFRGEIERVFFKMRGEPTKTLSDRAHTLTVLDMELGLHKGEGKAPFIVPVKRLSPSVDGIGTETIVDRRDRKIKLLGESLSSLLIPKSSETGQFLVNLWNEYSDFPTRYSSGQVEQEETPVMAHAVEALRESPFDPNWGEDDF
ncbi:DUF5895 domain-containing protein [Aphanothece hegewaldii]|uniref:DUF5895 domain-containing protein n=1 Tax=Aphanothece hegewaldii TaxID=1521625 RepID=UPI001C634FD8|nr:DUF5895 domain-containing protein [Aphanothece hegewaldii]